MSWQGIEGHDAVVEQFRRASARPPGNDIFVCRARGDRQANVRTAVAQALLCRTRKAVELDPCGACEACRQVLAQTHPDLILVAKPPDKSAIPLELLIGSGERRHARGTVPCDRA